MIAIGMYLLCTDPEQINDGEREYCGSCDPKYGVQDVEASALFFLTARVSQRTLILVAKNAATVRMSQ